MLVVLLLVVPVEPVVFVFVFVFVFVSVLFVPVLAADFASNENPVHLTVVEYVGSPSFNEAAPPDAYEYLFVASLSIPFLSPNSPPIPNVSVSESAAALNVSFTDTDLPFLILTHLP
ncbi:hypothetical protein EUBVEN_01958 [Eubacterium ventriosum ATCC 27560]|uniref:Uncharacterized protein n=1 Tax=Eubacterium ventriosum ATCC 27560 TaxID=411463 RepID=A5Z8B8_9FIRM|nr:hypothetical protein EUBVEN_01958 [Eubacterium ventriosum ATCC 27560]